MVRVDKEFIKDVLESIYSETEPERFEEFTSKLDEIVDRLEERLCDILPDELEWVLDNLDEETEEDIEEGE